MFNYCEILQDGALEVNPCWARVLLCLSWLGDVGTEQVLEDAASGVVFPCALFAETKGCGCILQLHVCTLFPRDYPGC